LYALELARGATAVGLQPGGLALPVSLRAAIAGRLATVGDDVAALLQAVSALAHTTVGELSAALPGRDVGALLAQAEARGLIHRAVNGGEDDVVLFCGSGTTGAVDKLVRVLPLADAVVFLGPYEHHSHELPWRESAADVVTSARPPAAAWTWPTWTAS
jgi:selenocysteine lyase/cysteine desulfurase